MKMFDEYRRFFGYLLTWLAGGIESLVVVGSPGVGKSWAVKRLLRRRRHHWFSARQSALQVYKQLHDDPSIPIVFDDVSSILRDDTMVDMMKNLCERGTSTLRWGTNTPKLEGRPRSFRCNAPVLILLNRIPAKNPDLLAVLDRCQNFEFRPTKREVIAYMRLNFPNDGKLIDLLEELAVMPSVRTLMLAREWEASPHLDLHEELLAECGVPDSVQTLVKIMERFPKDEWCDRYRKATEQTDRQFRRNRRLAVQVLACRRREKACPDVQFRVPKPPPPPPNASSPMEDLDSGHLDTGDSLPGFPDMSNRLRWWNPENN